MIRLPYYATNYWIILICVRVILICVGDIMIKDESEQRKTTINYQLSTLYSQPQSYRKFPSFLILMLDAALLGTNGQRS